MLFYFMMLETKVFWRGAYFFRLEILLYRLSSALSALLLTMILCCEYNKDTFKLAARSYFLQTEVFIWYTRHRAPAPEKSILM